MDANLGKKLKALREKDGMTQEEAAKALAVDVRTVQRIERGQVAPSNETSKAICAVFGCELDEIRPAREPAATTTPVELSWDPEAEVLVRLEPIHRAFHIGECLWAINRPPGGMVSFRTPTWMSGLALEIVDRVSRYLGRLALSWPGTTDEARREAVLDLQEDMDALKRMELTLTAGWADQVVLPPEGLRCIGPRNMQTIVMSVARVNEPVPAMVVDRVVDWPRGS